MSHSAPCPLETVLLWDAGAPGCPGPDDLQSISEEQWPPFPTHSSFSAYPALLLLLTEHGAENLLKPGNQEATSVLTSGG